MGKVEIHRRERWIGLARLVGLMRGAMVGSMWKGQEVSSCAFARSPSSTMNVPSPPPSVSPLSPPASPTSAAGLGLGSLGSTVKLEMAEDELVGELGPVVHVDPKAGHESTSHPAAEVGHARERAYLFSDDE